MSDGFIIRNMNIKHKIYGIQLQRKGPENMQERKLKSFLAVIIKNDKIL